MTVTDEARTLARLAGVSSQQMQRAMDARDLVDRAERRRRPLAALETATRRLPAYARRLLAEDDKRAATLAAIELGLADADQPMSVALAELQQLALADQVTSAPQPAAPVKPTAAAAKPRHEGILGLAIAVPAGLGFAVLLHRCRPLPTAATSARQENYRE